MAEEPRPPEEEQPADEPVTDQPPEGAESPPADEPPAEPAAEESGAEEQAPDASALEPGVEQAPQAPAEEPAPEAEPAEEPAPDAEPAEEPSPAAQAPPAEPAPSGEQPAKPEIPGADLEVDIVPEGVDPLTRGDEPVPEELAAVEPEAPAAPPEEPPAEPPAEEPQPVARATIDLGADARYRATGKRKTAVARVILRPGSGEYTVNGRPLDRHFPRPTLQRNIRQPLETVGYDARMDVAATIHGGGVSAQAGALRHGIARALIEADPHLRAELKRRGFLTRDPRVKERKKAGLKKARKRPQFSKR